MPTQFRRSSTPLHWKTDLNARKSALCSRRAPQHFSNQNRSLRLDSGCYTILRLGSLSAPGVTANCFYYFYRFDNPERRPKRYDCTQRGQRHHQPIRAGNHRTIYAVRKSPLVTPVEVDARPRSTSSLTTNTAPPWPHFCRQNALTRCFIRAAVFPAPRSSDNPIPGRDAPVSHCRSFCLCLPNRRTLHP